MEKCLARLSLFFESLTGQVFGLLIVLQRY